MTNPFMVNPSGSVIQDPGVGGAIASSLAQVLAAQQQQRETQMRLMQLQQQAAQQQALAQYYQDQTRIQGGDLALRQQEAASKQSAQAQVGALQRAALGGGTPAPAPMPANPAGIMAPGGGVQASAQTTASPLQQALQGGAAAIQGAGGVAGLFQGVSDENVPAAVQGLQEVQALSPKPPELPTSAKEFQFAQQLAAIDPKLAKFFIDNWVNKPSTVINNIPQKGETSFAVETGKQDAQAGAKSVDEAGKAAASFPALKEATGLIDKSFTGFGANQALAVARAIGATGFKPAKDKAATTQELVKLLREGVIAQLQTRALGSGTAVSDADRVFMERQAGADLSLQPDAIKRIIRINIGTGVERMVSAKMELQQQQEAYPESAKLLQSKIDLIDRKLKPIWKQYQDMLAQEAKNDAQTRMDAGPQADQLFPAR